MLNAGPQLDLSQNVTVAQLETLLNGLLENEERLPYSFYLHDVELADELGQHMLKHKAPPSPSHHPSVLAPSP